MKALFADSLPAAADPDKITNFDGFLMVKGLFECIRQAHGPENHMLNVGEQGTALVGPAIDAISVFAAVDQLQPCELFHSGLNGADGKPVAKEFVDVEALGNDFPIMEAVFT